MITKNRKYKGLKKMCVYIWQEKKGDTINTVIDCIGDEELYKELKKSILREELERIIYK